MTLPKIKDIYSAPDIWKADALMTLLNQPPKPEWVKVHPFINVQKKVNGQLVKMSYNYVPIERVEWLLKTIFKRYRIEITNQGTAFNAVWVTARVNYFNPISNEWDFHDGIGAKQLQTAKGTSPAGLGNINNGAVTMAMPDAYHEAIKNACKKFGKIFGSDLNRDCEIVYEADMTLIPFDEKHPNFDKAIDAIKSGKFTIEQVKSKYNISEEIENKILDFIR